MNKRAIIIILVALALFLIAGTIRSGWLYLVSSTLLAIVAAGVFAGWRGTRGLRLVRECPAEVFEGEAFSVLLKIQNTGRFAKSLVTFRDLQFSGRRPGLVGGIWKRRSELKSMVKSAGAGDAGKDSDSPTATIVSIPPRGEVKVTYQVTPPRRGIYETAEIVIGCGGVFGSAEVKKSVKVDSPITVYPRVYRLESFQRESLASVLPVESREWSRKGSGQDYYGIREYAMGDSLRNIHWRSTARHGSLIVKEYQQERRPSGAVVVFLREPICGTRDVNSMEDSLRAAASIADFYAERGSLPMLITPWGDSFNVVEPVTLRECFEMLAGYRPEAIPSDRSGQDNALTVGEALAFSGYSLGPGSTVSLVTNIEITEVLSAMDFWVGWGEHSLVLAVDQSYGAGWSKKKEDGVHEVARDFTQRGINTFVLTGSREIGDCLNEPLSTTNQ